MGNSVQPPSQPVKALAAASGTGFPGPAPAPCAPSSPKYNPEASAGSSFHDTGTRAAQHPPR